MSGKKYLPGNPSNKVANLVVVPFADCSLSPGYMKCPIQPISFTGMRMR